MFQKKSESFGLILPVNKLDLDICKPDFYAKFQSRFKSMYIITFKQNWRFAFGETDFYVVLAFTGRIA